MRYGKYYVSTCRDVGIERKGADGKSEICHGYYCEVYDDPAYGNRIDCFCLAVGHEIPDESQEALDRGIRDYLGVPSYGMTEVRKSEIIDRLLAWMIEHHHNDEDLFHVLHSVIGMTQEELNAFSIESLDEYFENENESQTGFVPEM